MNKIGLIIGSGTGRELVEVFTHILCNIAESINKRIDIIKCEHEFKSYAASHDLGINEVKKIVQEEMNILGSFYKQFYGSGGRIVFRTAINAETLYLFRKKYQAVKITEILLKDTRLLVVRDEMQGYYANDYYEKNDEVLKFEGSYEKKNFQIISKFSLNEAKKILRAPFETWIVYKHHLFDNVFEEWMQDIFPKAQFFQPNHATELLWQYPVNVGGKDILIIMGNEVGDILHEVLIFHLELGTRQTLFSKNVYLCPELNNLREYQTIHGSVDYASGKDIINPTATLRALGYILENEFNIEGFSNVMENALKFAYKVVAKSGSLQKTSKIVNTILEYLLEWITKKK